jgi:hypothetical protein
MKRSAGITVLSCLLAGCSASGARFLDTPFATQAVTDDRARIVFYRESDHNFGSVTLGIDDSIVGALAQNGFIVADIAPGDHKVSAWLQYTPLGESKMKMRVLAGETYYIRASGRSERMLYPLLGALGVVLFFTDRKGEFQLDAVMPAVALPVLEELKLSE